MLVLEGRTVTDLVGLLVKMMMAGHKYADEMKLVDID